jgi:hypothetical protein
VSPNPVASWCSAAAAVYCIAVTPLPAHAVRAIGSISRSSRSRTSRTMPSSTVLWPRRCDRRSGRQAAGRSPVRRR